MKLVALKPFSYNTRRLEPGNVFEAKDPDGRLLIGVRKARKMESREVTSVPAPPEDLIAKIADVVPAREPDPESEFKLGPKAEGIFGHPGPTGPSAEVMEKFLQGKEKESLFEEATKLGIKVNPIWGIPRLKREIAKVK